MRGEQANRGQKKPTECDWSKHRHDPIDEEIPSQRNQNQNEADTRETDGPVAQAKQKEPDRSRIPDPSQEPEQWADQKVGDACKLRLAGKKPVGGNTAKKLRGARSAPSTIRIRCGRVVLMINSLSKYRDEERVFLDDKLPETRIKHMGHLTYGAILKKD